MEQNIGDILKGLGTISQGYGATEFAKTSGFYANNSHPSVDIVLKDPNVKPLISGTVEYAKENGGWGGQVKIKGDDGKYYYYSHLKQFNVKPGQKIDKNTIIGIMGGGANDPMRGSSTGQHLDVGIETAEGKRVNPLEQILSNISPQTSTQTTIPKSNLLTSVKNRLKNSPAFKQKFIQLLRKRKQGNVQTNLPTIPQTTEAQPFDKIKSAIAQQESGNNYKAIGPAIPGRSDRALGKYQIMGANLPQWSSQALGRVVSADEFLANPDIQEKIATTQMKNYYDSAIKLGLQGDDVARYVSTSWYAGQGTANSKVKNGKFIYSSSDLAGQPIVNGVAPSISSYGTQVLSRIK